MSEPCNIPDQAPTELIDFAGVASLLKHIEITHKVTYGSITIGRYFHYPNSGVAIGTRQHSIIVHEGESLDMEWRISRNAPLEKRRLQVGDILILPSDTLVYKRWWTSSRMLFMAIDSSFFRQVVDEAFSRHSVEFRPQIGIRDSVIEGMAEAWREELRERGAGGRVHVEALATALTVHLSRTYGEIGANFRAISGGMNTTRLERVVDYIETHLSEDIGLCTLAEVAGFSVHHFSEVFKAETGLAPHQFLIDRRVHRSKELLLGTDLPIAEIAVEVGFSGQSHFTEHFRKFTATTPLRFRQRR